MSILESKEGPMPGTRELTTGAYDRDGRYWQVGTIYRPLRGGMDSYHRVPYVVVSIGPWQTRFFAQFGGSQECASEGKRGIGRESEP